MTRFFSRSVTLLFWGILLASGCSSSTPTTPTQSAGQTFASAFALHSNAAPQVVKPPALVAVTRGGMLKYYPIEPRGGRRLEKIAKIPGMSGASSMAGHGHVVAIVNQSPPGAVLYNITTKQKTMLSDPYGTPIDIAIDKQANVFLLNFRNAQTGNVTMFAANSTQPQELDCSLIGDPEAIAADNEGDIFVNGYEHSFTGVVEIPKGTSGLQPQDCKQLALKDESGYAAGLAVDPKTDELVVLDDPDQCAGGIEGRMTIYPKPYQAKTGHSVNLNGNCVGQMRLNADSTIVFAFDESVSGGVSYILQRTYPGGRNMGTYRRGDVSGITTIPNTLPN